MAHFDEIAIKMDLSIIPVSLDYLKEFRDAFDAVARERKFLVLVCAPSMELVEDYVRHNMEKHHLHILALLDGHVVGWCDATRSDKEGFTHTGHLGIAVLKEHRGKGIGKALLRHTIDAAFSGPLLRIELEVFATNTAAMKLYESFGFLIEGTKRKARIIDGITDDIHIMALLK